MNKIMIFLLLICFANQAKSQLSSPYMTNNQNYANMFSEAVYEPVGNYKVSGSADFMFRSFLAKVTFKDGAVVNKDSISYHTYFQKLEYKSNRVSKGKLIGDIDWFELSMDDQRVFKFLRCDSLGIDKKGFAMELVKGKNISLYRYNYSTLAEHPNFISSTIRAFEPYYEYYVITASTPLKKLKMSEKNLLKLLGNSEKVESYVTDNKIDFNNEVDILKLAEYVNTL